MQPKHYDVIILGNSLASLLAGALLAKGGCRVLTFEEPAAPPPAWLFSSLHLERILERLDGASCLVPPSPFQVVTRESRLTLAPGEIADELRRELPAAHDAAIRRFDDLRQLGGRLEETLMASDGLPLTGLGSRLRFLRGRWRRGIGRSALDRPVAAALDLLPNREAHTVGTALFEGLSLTSCAHLPTWAAALLWSGAARDRGVDTAALGQFLRERYRQFHGRTELLDRLHALEGDGKVTLKGGSHCRADHILIGSPAGSRLAGILHPIPSPMTFSAGPLDEPLPPLLEARVIAAGALPMRMTFQTEPKGVTCRVECGDGSGDDAVAQVQASLAAIHPFSGLRLQPERPGTPAPTPGRFPGRRTLVHTGRLLDCHDGVLPALGATGGALTALTVASHLLLRLRRR